MLYYTVRRWPLWRVLLAQSLTIAVGLLIELATVRQGLAHDACEPIKCSSKLPVPMCGQAHYASKLIADEDANHPGGVQIPRPEVFGWAVGRYNIGRKTPISELEVKKLKINQPLVKMRGVAAPGNNTPDENSMICACGGDPVCFPICSNGGFDGQKDRRQQGYFECTKAKGEWEWHRYGRLHAHLRRLHRHRAR
jgi:hypothetical protein